MSMNTDAESTKREGDANPDTLKPLDVLKATSLEKWTVIPGEGDQILLELLNDKPDLTVESLSDELKSRLSVHFIGRKHTGEVTDEVFNKLRECQPDIILVEARTIDPQHLHNLDLMTNLNVRQRPLHITVPDLEGRVMAIGHPPLNTDFDPILVKMAETGVKPLIRYIDIPDTELVSEFDFLQGERNVFLARTLQYLTKEAGQDSLSGTIKTLKSRLVDDVKVNQFREQWSESDISRIVANMSNKLRFDKLSIAVISGGVHAPQLAEYARGQGLKCDVSYTVGSGHSLTEGDFRIVKDELLYIEQMLYDLQVSGSFDEGLAANVIVAQVLVAQMLRATRQPDGNNNRDYVYANTYLKKFFNKGLIPISEYWHSLEDEFNSPDDNTRQEAKTKLKQFTEQRLK